MDPTKSYEQKIRQYIEKHKEVTARKIRQEIDLSEPTLFKHLHTLLEKGVIKKYGSVPKVVYTINPDRHHNEQEQIESDVTNLLHALSAKQTDTIEKEYLYISPDGTMTGGIRGFVIWCKKQKLDAIKTAHEYLSILKKWTIHKQDGLIDATFKIHDSFGTNVYVDKLFYLDFYAVERFGRTKLAQLAFQAKQAQDEQLMPEILNHVRSPIETFIHKHRIEAIGYIPPTVKRSYQFQTELERLLNLPLPRIELTKIITGTPVQQKMLKKQEERILNAQKTIFLQEKKDTYSRLLLIDDFVGSGATINQVAHKVRQIGGMKESTIYGFALTGSIKGFEVISQM